MSCSNPSYLPFVKDWKGRFVPIPCRKCLCCRRDKLLYWENRAKWEFNNSSASAFVTLTYDDNHLPLSDGFQRCTLVRDDLHRYLDSLRHRCKKTILPKGCRENFSYLAVGEYGDKFQRAHYHLLIFGLDWRKCYGFLQSGWHNGSIAVLPIKQGAIRYVLKYMSKQQFGNGLDSVYFDTGREPPFIMYSKGFGSGLFLEHKKEIEKTGVLRFGNKVVPIPTYWKNKYFIFDDNRIHDIERKRQLRESIEFGRVKERGYKDYNEYRFKCIRLQEENMFNENRLRNKEVFYDYSFPAHLTATSSVTPVSDLVNKCLEV